MPEVISTLLYGSAIDISGLEKSARAAREQIKSIGDFATKTFDQSISRTLANSVQPAELTAGVARAKGILGSLGIDVGKTFERTLGRNLARQTLKPFVEESSTFLGQLKQGFTSTLGVGRVALGVGLGNVLADVTRGFANAVKESIQFAAAFESALARVQTIADRDFNLTAVRKEIQEISTRIPQDLLTLTQGLGDIIGSGFSQTADAMKILEVTAKAATAGVTQTSEASRALVFILNAFGKSAEDAEHVSDVLFKTVDEGVITFQELSANIGEVVSTASLAGVSIEDLGAAFAVSTKNGINAAETATALKNAILSIIAPAEGAKKVAKELGLDFSKAGIAAAGGFENFVQLIAKATAGDLRKIEELFPEKRALKEIAILAGTSAKEFDRLGTSFNNLAEVSGATERALSIMTNTAENQYKLLKNNLAIVISDIGGRILSDLLPALRSINDIFSDVSPIEQTIRMLQELGVATEELNLLRFAADSEKAMKAVAELGEEIEKLTDSSELLNEGFFDTRTALSQIFVKDITTVGDFAKQIQSLLGTLEGEAEVNKKIADSRARLLELTKQYRQVVLGLQEGDAEALQQSIETEGKRIGIMTKLLSFHKAIADEERKANEERFKALGIIRAGGAAGPPVPVDQQKKFTEESKLSAEQQAEIAKHAEAAGKFIEDAARKLELLSAIDEPERRLIAIRQEADERRKQFADQAKAIEAINRLERAERAKTIDDFGDKLRKEVKQRIEQIVKLTIEPKLITDIKLPEIGLDEQETRTISERINRTLNEALVESPASILLNKIVEVGQAIDDEFIEFAGTIDRGFGVLLSGIANFAENIQSKNILGAITGVIGTIGKIFGGGGDSERKRAEAERRQQLAAEESARAAEKAAQALENLRRAAEEFGAGRLIEEITKLDAEITSITDSTRKLTQEELDRAVALLEEADNLRSNISSLRALIEAYQQEGRDTTQLEEDMRQLELQLEPLAAALSDLGINLGNVTPLEIDRLKVLLEERGVLDDVIDRFQAFGDGLRGLLDRLQLGFELLDTTDPAKKLEELVAALTDTFGFKIPAQFADLNEFILAGLDAVRAGGQQLIDFLIAAGIEELGAEEFADLLRTLNEFSTGIDDVGDSIADAFGDLLDKLQLEFQLLDIEDPIKQLRRLREEVARQFGAVVPETLEGIDDLIKSGLQALLAGGDALKAFLASINLEEFTEEQFRDFLESLEGLGDEAARQIEEATAAAEEITTSQVKSITFQQANKLIDEVTTIRIVVTQMLDQMRLDALANLPNIDLNNLAAALSGLNAGSRNNYFIVRNGGVEKVSENQLSDIDRRLIEQARAAAQARGIN